MIERRIFCGNRRRVFSAAANLLLAAVLAGSGTQASAQSLHVVDVNRSANIIFSTAPMGSAVAGVTPEVRAGGAVITNGVSYALAGSALFTVNTTSGAILSTRPLAGGDHGHYPVTLTVSYQGAVADLPLTIGIHPSADRFYICDRTPAARDEILREVGGSCGSVRVDDLALIASGANRVFRILSNVPLGTLQDSDFDGMTGATDIDLADLGLDRLPPNLFRGLDALEFVSLRDNGNIELPAFLVSDFERRSPRFFLVVDSGASIGGIEYHTTGREAIGSLTLSEGESATIQIEAVGGVGSTLTLVFRPDSRAPVTAVPQTITIAPPANSASVQLTASADTDIADNIGMVRWTWGRFLVPNIGTGADPVEQIPTPPLQVTVPDRDGLEDADPAPNRISERASAEVEVSGWSPRVLVGGVPRTVSRYSLLSDAGGLFEIDATSGTLSLVSGRMLNYRTAVSHEVTVAAQVSGLGSSLLAVTIDVLPGLVLRDANPVPDIISVSAAAGTQVAGVTPEALLGTILTDGLTYVLTGSSLFGVNAASGAILSARLFTNDDIGDYPVTLTVSYQGDTADLPLTIGIRRTTSICNRTPVAQSAILSAILTEQGNRYDCHTVPLAAMESVRELLVPTSDILQAGDFGGLPMLTTLDLSFTQVTGLPENIFSGLTNLVRLDLSSADRLTSLPAGVFRDLASLRTLRLLSTPIGALPARLVAGLERPDRITFEVEGSVRIGGLQYRLDGAATATTESLTLEEGAGHDLQVAVDGGVGSTLTLVFRADAALPFTITPPTITLTPSAPAAVVRVTAADDMEIASMSAGLSWAWGMFNPPVGEPAAAAEIRTRDLRIEVRNTDRLVFNDADLSANTIAAGAATGTQVAGVAPAARVGGLVVTGGVVYALTGSDSFTVNAASGAILSTRLFPNGEIGRRYPVTMTASYQGATADLPLTIGVHPAADRLYLCDRTLAVRNAILAAISNGSDCASVASADVASISSLDFSGHTTPVPVLRVDDFEGMPGLASLTLRSFGLERLPPDILSHPGNLASLDLSDNAGLTELPARLVADLEKPVPITFGVDSGVRIGGVEYRLAGAAHATTGPLMLEEGQSVRLQIHIAGGVGSTLTLVARIDGGLPVTVTPETVPISPYLLRTPSVELTAPANMDFGDSAGSVSWAWERFNASRSATEIRTQSLPVSVRDTDRFEDLDPAPNQIGELALAGAGVSGWSPHVVVDGVTQTAVRYSLSSDAGGRFAIDAASGALSLVSAQRLDYATSTFHEVTVVAQVPSGSMASLAVIISVFTLRLEDADPALNTIAATATAGTQVAGVAPLALLNGSALTSGIFYTLAGSALFTVDRTSGAILSTRLFADGDRGDYPVTLSVSYQDITADLPLVIGIRRATSICGRTPAVRDAILSVIRNEQGNHYDCRAVPLAALESIRELGLPSHVEVLTLQAGDFAGMPLLTTMNLSFIRVAALPENIFSGLTNLASLNLSGADRLTALPEDIFTDLANLRDLGLAFTAIGALPARLVADLEKPAPVTLAVDSGVRLSGVQYRWVGETTVTTSLLALDEGVSRRLQVEVEGGVGSTLTLVLRADAELPFTVVPERITIGPSRPAVVELTALTDLDAENGSGLMSWAWGMFERSGVFAGATEIRTQDLQVNVRDRRGFGDTDPNPNRIAETAPAGAEVSGWSPQVLVDGVVPPGVSYSLLPGADAGGRFVIDAASGALSLASGQTLDYATSSAHEVTVVAQVAAVTFALVVVIEVFPLVFEDTDPSPNRISEAAPAGVEVSGWSPQVLVDGVVPPGVSYSLLPGADAGGRFAIDAASGALSLASGQTLDYDASTSHEVTVVAQVAAATFSLVVVIEVFPLVFEDADPSPDTILVTAPPGTQVAGVMPVVRVDGIIVTSGVSYALTGSDLFTVSTASGAIFLSAPLPVQPFLDADIGHYPVTLTASYQRAMVDLPLSIATGFSVCDRTPVIRMEILRFLDAVPGENNACDFVPVESMDSIYALDFSGYATPVATLQADDFAGLTGLNFLTMSDLGLMRLPPDIFGFSSLLLLDLSGNNLTSLPEGVFSGAENLATLNLSGNLLTSVPEGIFSGVLDLANLNLAANSLTSLPEDIFSNLPALDTLNLRFNADLTELPARLVADLEKMPSITLTVGRDVRIGGIQYRLVGAATATAGPLTLDEGDSLDLQVGVDGGAGSTVTLVLRTDDGALPFTVTPTTIAIGPSNPAVVGLMALPDRDFENSVSPMSWAWQSFTPGDTASVGVTEIRTRSVQVNVRDTDRFEDADPSPNRISEAAPAAAAVSGWSPRVVVGGVAETGVRYSLLSDAGGLFEIDTAGGALSLVAGQALDYGTSTFHEVTVVAQVEASGATASLVALIAVSSFVFEDADPSPNLIAANAVAGTPVTGVAPVVRVDGVTATSGVAYALAGSDRFTVNTTSGAIFASGLFAGAAVGHYPVLLTAAHAGVTATLPLTIRVLSAAGRISICNRTAVVRTEILRLINRAPGNNFDCNSVPAASVASIETLDFSGYSTSVATLQVHDFEGLPMLTTMNLSAIGLVMLPETVFSTVPSLEALDLTDNILATLPENLFNAVPSLQTLDLSGNILTTLPENLFSAVPSLQTLDLGGNLLTTLPGNLFSAVPALNTLDLSGNFFLPELPARLLADLEKRESITLEVDSSVRMGGVQYLLDGGVVAQRLRLDEGASLRFQIAVEGGVGSTLTLALRADGELPFTVTPTTVTISPSSGTAVVALTVPVDETVDGASIATTSWAWRMFNPPDVAPEAAIEIRTQSLPVEVEDRNGFVDADPAANRISRVATAGDRVAGWSPQVVVDGVAVPGVRYSLLSDAGGLFRINSGTGALSLAAGQTLDSAPSSHQVRVFAQAPARAYEVSRMVTIDVVALADLLSFDGVVTGSISEAAAVGAAVSDIRVSLVNAGAPPGEGVVYALAGGSARIFALAVSGNVAGLRLADARLDHETTPVYTLTLQAAYRGASVSTQLTVNVLNVVEEVTLTLASEYPVSEDAAVGTVIPTMALVRTEGGVTRTRGVRYAKTGDEAFGITSGGDIVVTGPLDYEASTSHILFLTASYQGVTSDAVRVIMAVTDVTNEPQIVDELSAANTVFNFAGGQVSGLALVLQIDGVTQQSGVSWRLDQGDDPFEIDRDTAVITLLRPLAVGPSFHVIVVAATAMVNGAPVEAPPLPLTVEVLASGALQMRIRVFLEGAVIP